jgi:transcriptional regulator with XRE-family HTH domain
MPRPRKKPPRNDDLAALGKAVEQLRKERGDTQEGVGSAEFTDHKLAGKIERGHRNPSYITLVRLAKALGTTPGRLVSLADRFRAEAESGSSPRDV